MNTDGWKPGAIKVGGWTRRPRATWAVAHKGMPLGQQWLVRGDDDVPALEGVTGIPPTEFVMIMNPRDPAWLAMRGDNDVAARFPSEDTP